MIMFSEQFKQSFEIEYNGKRINAFYRFERKGSFIFKFTFVSSASDYGQAIVMHLYSFRGNNVLSGMGKLPYDYYGAPWEAEADRLGGVYRTKNNTPWPAGAYKSYGDLIRMFY